MGRGQELLDAAREGNSRTVEKILAQITKRSGPFTSLRRGAGPNVQDDNGYTPLHHACLNGHKDIVRMLLAIDASPCAVDKKGATPLHLAAFKGDLDAVRMLLEHNNPPVNVDQLTHDGDSALLIAAQFGFVNVVAQLVARGADVTVKNVNGDSALDLAAQYGKLSVVKHLLHVRPQLVDQYMARNIVYTSTPLHRASMTGRNDVVEALIDAGMDPNVRTAKGTPLHEAARYGKASVVRVLLNRGADLHAMDSDKKTVYDLLAEYPPEALRKVRKVIREHVTNVATYDSDKEDLPPFPVHPDYSPTPIQNTSLCTNTTAYSNNFNCYDFVTKLHYRLTRSPLSSLKSRYPNDIGIRPRTKTSDGMINKPFKNDGEYIKSSDPRAISKFNQQNRVIKELKIIQNNPEDDLSRNQGSVYQNLSPKLSLKRLARISPKTSAPFPDNQVKFNSLLQTSSFLKDKLKPYLEKDDNYSIYAPSGFSKENDYCHVGGIYANCPSNLSNSHLVNLPDDDKVKSENFEVQPMDPRYVLMSPQFGENDSDSQYVRMKPEIDDLYTYENRQSCDNVDQTYVNGEYAKRVREEHNSNTNLKISSANPLKVASVYHLKGDEGCLYASDDVEYIYEFNPETVRGDVHPFIRKKEKASPKPCYCHEDPDIEQKINKKIISKELNDSQLFYSCQDIYEQVKNTDDENFSLSTTVKSRSTDLPTVEGDSKVTSKATVVALIEGDGSLDSKSRDGSLYSKSRGFSTFRRKLFQVKQVFTDWKTSEPQKITNNNDSLISSSSSSITKKHPPSFVKKFASKCLGLKAKFNSAPNISNSSSVEVDVKSKPLEHKYSTNTLLIGNSKFFKMLSKKEESGEVVCNDEFDTISLDRLGTLNRDSVVNRSNRSCPGFKTSLPNISENNELSESQESLPPESDIVMGADGHKVNNDQAIHQAINYNTNYSIFEPRVHRESVISTASTESKHLINECYEPYSSNKNDIERNTTNVVPIPQPRPTIIVNTNVSSIYENVLLDVITMPTPAARTHIPTKLCDESQQNTLYENVAILQEKKQPEPMKRTVVPSNSNSSSTNGNSSSNESRSSTMSSDSMIDETNLEDILLSEKSKSFRHRKIPYSKLQVSRTQSFASDSSDVTEASALENVDCSGELNEKSMYLSMTGTLPIKKPENVPKKKVLFRHKTFTNIEADRNSIKIKDLPEWNNAFMKENLVHYHIRGTGHCIHKAPTVEEFIYIFNRDTLYSDVPPFTRVPDTRRDSEFETAICFCRARPTKFHSSAEDLIDKTNQSENVTAAIDIEVLKKGFDVIRSSFTCYCDSGTCPLHTSKRVSSLDYVVKFSALKKSISTPDITLNLTPYSTASKSKLPKNKSVPNKLEEPYAVVNVEDIIARKSNYTERTKDLGSPIYTPMSHPSTLSSTASVQLYSVKDIDEVISLSSVSTSPADTISNASGVCLLLNKSSSSEYSGHTSLKSCNSNVTTNSDVSFKSCLEEQSDDSDGTLHSDEVSSDAETVKSDVSTGKRPWVHSDSFRFGNNSKPEIDLIMEEGVVSNDNKSESSKYESGICLEGSVSSSSECEDDSGIPRVDADVSNDCASLERVSGLVGAVRSGSGRRRWDETEGTSEGDALSVSSAASSCAPLHLTHHHPYSKVSPTPPKKPPRRNLSVSPTHANSPSSGYSYELRPHARSQDDLDDIQGAKHYLKHGRSVDQYVDGKLSYSEYEENHNSPRVAPIPNPRPSLKQRSQPVAITAMYENIVIKEQNPRRKLRRNNFAPGNDNYEQRMTDRVRKYSHQEKSSLESLLDDQSMNSPSDCERYYDSSRSDIPLSPTHYEQPPTPDHPPPSAKQAENCIHERIRPLSQLIMEVVEEIRTRKMSQSDIINS